MHPCSSPHLLEARERIRINNVPLSKEKFAKYFWQCWCVELEAVVMALAARKVLAAPNDTHICAPAPPRDLLHAGAGAEAGPTSVLPPYFRFLTLVAFKVSGSARSWGWECEGLHHRRGKHLTRLPCCAPLGGMAQAFLGEQVDVAVVEVGIGGRYDATNILPRCATRVA